jgi:hypothetical protein
MLEADISVQELAKSIARRGRIPEPAFLPLLDDVGAATCRCEVPARGHRFRTQELLMKQTRAVNAPVRCGPMLRRVRSPDTRPLKMLQDARMAASTGRKAASQMTGEWPRR